MSASGNDGPDGQDPWNKESKRKFNNKPKSEYFDPCQEAAERSIRCLRRNGGDRKMCTDYFEAYRACKKEWTEKRKKESKTDLWAWWNGNNDKNSNDQSGSNGNGNGSEEKK